MNPKLFDIHAHVNFKEFDSDREKVIKRALDAGIWMINVGSDYESSKKAVEIAEKYNKGVYAAVGIHPSDIDVVGNRVSDICELANHPKVVAIGECGLDYKFQNPNDKLQTNSKIQIQKDLFKQQIELALEIDKPLMIHCRDAAPATPERSDGGRAHKEVLNILATYYSLLSTCYNGNIHFFSGTWEQAQKYFDLGFTVSFTGVITFANQYDEIIKKSAVDKIMVETDAPFVAPIPYRGQRNEPFYVQEIAKKMAEIRGISYEELAKITTQNALRLFFKDASV